MWPCGNLVYLVYRFVTCLFIAKESLQLHHISEEKALPQIHIYCSFEQRIFLDFEFDMSKALSTISCLHWTIGFL